MTFVDPYTAFGPERRNPLCVSCDTCHVGVAQPCETVDGKPRTPHITRRRASGDVTASRRRVSSPAQVAARERNWSLLQVAGALGALQHVAGQRRLNPKQLAALWVAIDALRSLQESDHG